jgi:hypothetical protein
MLAGIVAALQIVMMVLKWWFGLDDAKKAKAKELLKPTSQRSLLGRVSQVPFSDQRGLVTGLLQSVGQRGFPKRHALAIASWIKLVSKTLLVSTCQQPSSCRGAIGARDIPIGEPHAS